MRGVGEKNYNLLNAVGWLDDGSLAKLVLAKFSFHETLRVFAYASFVTINQPHPLTAAHLTEYTFNSKLLPFK
jgi:hypothetical protein